MTRKRLIILLPSVFAGTGLMDLTGTTIVIPPTPHTGRPTIPNEDGSRDSIDDHEAQLKKTKTHATEQPNKRLKGRGGNFD